MKSAFFYLTPLLLAGCLGEGSGAPVTESPQIHEQDQSPGGPGEIELGPNSGSRSQELEVPINDAGVGGPNESENACLETCFGTGLDSDSCEEFCDGGQTGEDPPPNQGNPGENQGPPIAQPEPEGESPGSVSGQLED